MSKNYVMHLGVLDHQASALNFDLMTVADVKTSAGNIFVNLGRVKNIFQMKAAFFQHTIELSQDFWV